MKTIIAEKIYTPTTAGERFLPEGPYPVNDREFSWVAIQHGKVATYGSLNIFDMVSKTNKSFVLPGRPGFAFPTTRPNVFAIGLEREIGLLDTAARTWTRLVDGVDKDTTGTIINDGMVWGDCLIFGTKDLEFKTKKAGLYLFRMKDRKLTKLAGGQICSNGKVMLNDNGSLTLLDIDTPTQSVASYALDIEAGKLGTRKVVLDCKGQPGFPDGMTISPDQKSIFISFYNPDFAPNGETRQFDLADGSVIASYLTPNAPQATCPQLVKVGGKVHLVITTAVEHMTSERLAQSSDSGCLFAAETEYTEGTDTQKLVVE